MVAVQSGVPSQSVPMMAGAVAYAQAGLRVSRRDGTCGLTVEPQRNDIG